MKRLAYSSLIAFVIAITNSACVFKAEDHSVLPLMDQLLYVGASTGKLPGAPNNGTALQVMATLPVDGAMNVSVKASVGVSFNRAMAPDCVEVNLEETSCTGNFQLSSDGFATCVIMSGAPEGEVEGKTFMVAPVMPLKPSTNYKIRVIGDMIDLNENPMAGDYVTGTGFTTTAGNTKRTFLTNLVYNGNLAGIAGADAKCMGDANYPGTGVYKAMIVDGTNRIASITPNAGDGQVDWVLQPNTTYYRSTDMSPLMTTNANGVFVFGSLFNSPGLGSSFIATGLNSDWTSHDDHCGNWTVTTGFAQIGKENQTDGKSIDQLSGLCSFSTKKLLCVEQ